MIEVLETDGKFHERTCSEIGGVTLRLSPQGKRAGRGLSLEAASGGA